MRGIPPSRLYFRPCSCLFLQKGADNVRRGEREREIVSGSLSLSLSLVNSILLLLRQAHGDFSLSLEFYCPPFLRQSVEAIKGSLEAARRPQ